MPLRLGVVLPNLGELAEPDSLVSLAQQAEALGFDGVFLSDHLVVPTHPRSRYPYRSDGVFPLGPGQPVLEPVTALSFLAAATSRVRLGLSVLVLPYRHPVLAAKMLATLDRFSHGRLIVGVGVGWLAEEFQALGADYARRGSVAEEQLELLKLLWTQDQPRFAGRHYKVDGITCLPKPVQQPHPPLWAGGTSPRALSRAARLADGWHGIRQAPEDIARVTGELHRLRREANRGDARTFEISLRAGLDVTEHPLPTDRRLPLRGSPQQVAEDVARYAQAGLTYLVVEPRAASAGELARQMERLSQEVWPLLPGDLRIG
jgi:probable F420-dependent oxidoreductase